MRYLSDEFIAAQHKAVDDYQCPPSDYDCGGSFSFSGPPCGGCNDCAHAMVSHWLQKERERASMFQRAGFEYADPATVQLDPTLPGGYAPYHGEGGYHCWTAGEIDSPLFDWNRRA